MFDEYIESGMERLVPSAFFKKYNFFRSTHLTKFNTFTSDMQLPVGSCLHLLDNLYHLERNEETYDVPDINIQFINNETFRMFMYHVKSPMVGEDELLNFEKRYKFIPTGLLTNLKNFNRKNLSRIRPIESLKAINPSRNTLTIINHNPVFRSRIISSITPHYDRFRLIFSSILNVMSKIEGKTQYVLIPLGEKIYSKNMFTQAAKEIKPTSIRVKNDYHYFLMMHWLNFINTTSDQSLFLSYPKELWSSTNFIFYIGDKFAMYTLSDIVNLNADNKIYNRHVNQLNSLVLKEIAEKENNEVYKKKVEEAITEYTTLLDNEEVELDIVEKENKELDTERDKNRVPDKVDETNIDNNEKKVDKVNKIVKNTQNTINSITTDFDTEFNNILVSLDENRKEIVDNANTSSISTVSPIKETTNKTTKLTSDIDPSYTQEDTSSEFKEIDISFDIEEDEEKSSKVSIKGFSSISEVSDNYEKYIEELDKRSEDFINNADLTPAQKKRYQKLATAYKKVTINGVTLEDQIRASFDPNISNSSVNVGEGYLKDPSMANSSVMGYDDEYLNKLYFRHLAQVATSLNDKGMFLVNIEQEPVVDEFNRIMNYKFVYEDINGKRHTVKFSLPIVDRNGYCLVNGIKMYFKKQMVNLPICKVSDNRVSLASNYNKTIIERNTHKAHSFKPYFQRLINTINKKIKDVIKVEYNTKIYNSDLPYEFIEVMSLYKKIWFNYNSYDLHFTLSDIEEERLSSTIQPNVLKVLKSFEKKYGIYLGTVIISKATNYCFINKYNIITIISLEGTIQLRTSFIDLFSSIFKVSLNTLEEWTNIKIQDKLFPVIFLLCYRNGITKVLKELDASYKLIARDKAANRIEDLYQDNFNKINHLSSLDKLNLDDSEYVILGSASAMLYGYPHPNGNEDLDVITSPEVIERLIDNGFIKEKEKPGFSTPFYESLDGKIELSTSCDYLKADLEKVKEVSTLAFGYRFLTLEAVTEFYKNGYKAFKKEKHLVKYQWLKSNSKVDPIKSIKKTIRASDIVIPFKDKILVVPRYPLTNSLLLSGLLFFDTSRYNFEDFNLKDTYHLLLTDKGNGYRTNYLKGIDDHFNLFIDPMTRDILVQMNEPTEFGKLLIRATEMLTTIDYNEASAIANHRLRSYERFNAILYNKLARTYATYTKKSGAGNSFSIAPTEVLQSIISDPAMMNVEDINPIMDIKLKTSFTYGGSNGRTNESFVTNDRRFPKDGVGIMSEANNDNKGVGYNAYLSMDPKLTNVYGVLETLDNPRDAEPTEALSVSGLVFPGATNDDR